MGKESTKLKSCRHLVVIIANTLVVGRSRLCGTPPSHPPDALPLGTCLWKPTGLPSRSLQMLQTLGHYREPGQVANLHNTHII